MYKITLKGKAQTDYPYPQELNGIDCQEEFSAYFGDEEQCLQDKGVCNGYLEFKFEDNTLWSATTYNSPIELTASELDLLKDYTQGQWSDGIGEGFEQEPCYEDENGEEFYISPWYVGQEITAKQELI